MSYLGEITQEQSDDGVISLGTASSTTWGYGKSPIFERLDRIEANLALIEQILIKYFGLPRYVEIKRGDLHEGISNLFKEQSV